jgi:hypothetical protein
LLPGSSNGEVGWKVAVPDLKRIPSIAAAPAPPNIAVQI